MTRTFAASLVVAVALFLGPTLMTGLPLNASDAVAKLRECSAKIGEQGELVHSEMRQLNRDVELATLR